MELTNVPVKSDGKISGPEHVAIIMDGNGRWARNHGLARVEGHRAGTERIREVITSLADRDVRYVTIYAFSTENWGRPKWEINGLFKVMRAVLRTEIPKLHEQNVRILHLGNLGRLPKSLSRSIESAVELTSGNTGLTLSVCFDYGGRAEITEAVRDLMEKGIKAQDVTEEVIRKHLFLPEIPDPDLIIRTAGEQRLSNFLIWQSAYSEMYYTPIYWPDFSEVEVEKALEAYRKRERRFGKLKNE